MTDEQMATCWPNEHEIPNPEGPRADLPMIILPSDKVSITEAAGELFPLMAESRRFFVRGGRIMKLIERDDGLLALEILDAEAARSDFEKFGRLFAWRSGKYGLVLKPVICTAETAKALLMSQEGANLLPRVRGLINCPVIYERDGALSVADRGYDSNTERLVTGGACPPEVSLCDAVTSLLNLIEEFDFQSGGDKARAVASLITPALKLGDFIKGRVPADVAEADQSQSGKTYRQKLIAAIYNERVSLVTNRQGGVGSVDESLSQALIAGRPFIQFDNFRGRLDSQHLEAFLTAEGSFPCRVPYKGEITIEPENFFVFLTSNGVDTTRDLANRSSIIRIRKKPAGFTFRKYDAGDLLAHIRVNQAFYLGCIFAVIRVWHERGKTKTEETRHDFREWVQTLDWIVRHIFQLCPLMEGHQEAQVRVSNPDMVFLRSVALAIEKMGSLGMPQTASDIYALCESDDIAIPGCRGAMGDSERGARVIGGCMRRLFKNSPLVDIDELQVEKHETPVRRFDGNGYSPQKFYVFQRKGAAVAPNVSQLPDIPPQAPFFGSVHREPGQTVVSFREPWSNGGPVVSTSKDSHGS